MAAIKVTEECIGCESCVEVCPDVFDMSADGSMAVVKDAASTAACVEEAIEVCPVAAIVRE